MESVISKHSLNQDLVLNRGFRTSNSPKLAAKLKLAQPGDVIGFGSFQSTSLSPHVSLDFAGGVNGDGVLMKIKAPKGTKAYAWNSEKELVLSHNTKYKVTKVEPASPGRITTVYADLVE